MKNVIGLILLGTLGACAPKKEVAPPSQQPTTASTASQPSPSANQPTSPSLDPAMDLDLPEAPVQARECFPEDWSGTRAAMALIEDETRELNLILDRAIAAPALAEKKVHLQRATLLSVAGVKRCRADVRSIKIEGCTLPEVVAARAALSTACATYETTARRMLPLLKTIQSKIDQGRSY